MKRSGRPSEAGRGACGDGRHASDRGRGFAAVVAWTLLGGVLPGAGLWAGTRSLPRRGAAWTAVVAAVGVVVAALLRGPVAVAAPIGMPVVEWVAVDPGRLMGTAVAVLGSAAVWAGLVVVTHVAVRRHADLVRTQRAACTFLAAGLIAVGVVPAVKIADYVLVTRQTLLRVFGRHPSPAIPGAPQPRSGDGDPWARLPRVNVLLIGSDAGADRTGVRPDTLIVASIDTRTGDTVLFSLPRNLQRVPFPPGSPAARAYPDGFSCLNQKAKANTECLLNGVWTFAEQHAADYYPGVRDPGLTATVQAAEQVTGLSVNNYVMINLRGFTDFVNAIGGVTVTIRERLPVGGNAEDRAGTTSWLQPGRRKLDGYHALWFARSRWSTNDYDRMRRQRCVIAAVSQQADPVTLARNFPAVARAAQRNIETDVGLHQVPAWVQLAQRVQHAHVRSLPFTDRVIDTAHPDVDQVHALVRRALDPSSGSAPPGATARTRAPAPASRAAGTSAPARRSAATSGTSPAAEDVRDVC